MNTNKYLYDILTIFVIALTVLYINILSILAIIKNSNIILVSIIDIIFSLICICIIIIIRNTKEI